MTGLISSEGPHCSLETTPDKSADGDKMTNEKSDKEATGTLLEALPAPIRKGEESEFP